MVRFTDTVLAMALITVPAVVWAGGDWPEPMSAEQLESANGRQGVPVQWQFNDSRQNASISDNVLSGPVITGDNRITDHAFENMSGIATVIQNTGNQVVIQDSTQINILINH